MMKLSTSVSRKKELIRLVAKWMKADNEFGLGELKEKWHEPIHKISN